MLFNEIFIISAIGWSLTNLLVNGSIFDPIRNYLLVKSPHISKLLTCMQCSGFWVGILLGLLAYHGIIYNILSYIVIIHNIWYLDILIIFLHGVFISGFSVFANSILFFFHSFNKN